jgi:hypothetical protein
VSDFFIPKRRNIDADIHQLPAPLRRHVGFDARGILPRQATDDVVEADFHELAIIEAGVHFRMRGDPAVWKLAEALRQRGHKPLRWHVDHHDSQDIIVRDFNYPSEPSATDRHFADSALQHGDRILMRSAWLIANRPEQTVLWDHPDNHLLLEGLPIVRDIDTFGVELQLCWMVAQLTASLLLGPHKISGRSRFNRNLDRQIIDKLVREGFGPQTMAFETGLPESTIFRLQAEADRIHGRRRR